MNSAVSKAVLTIVLTGLFACSAASGEEPAAHGRGNVVVLQGAEEQTEAARQFSRFLEASVSTVPQGPDLFKEVQACLPEETPDRVLWLADSRVISVDVRADTALARAEFTTVAEQVGSTSTYYEWTVTQRVSTDAGTWRLVRVRDGAAPPTWKVCGESVEGDDFTRLGREIGWRPAGASDGTARALIDSIRTVRGRPSIR